MNLSVLAWTVLGSSLGPSTLCTAGSINGSITGATFILPLDSGFVGASNRSVEEMLSEVKSSTISALEFWLGQWVLPKFLPTVSRPKFSFLFIGTTTKAHA